MNRFSTLVRSSILALVVGAGAISTGCSTVREHQVDAMTGQVSTVNRRQFIGKAIFNRGRDKTTYVNGNPEMASGQMNPQFRPAKRSAIRAATGPAVRARSTASRTARSSRRNMPRSRVDRSTARRSRPRSSARRSMAPPQVNGPQSNGPMSMGQFGGR